ncbi:MAG: inositol monophosphatase family protein, partial [Clostridia bacterium]|nr:inositol monophosphatase family protein [Clostridia bacterium]
MAREIDAARDAAVRAGQYLRCKLDHVEDIQFKGTRDLVTEADKESERMIISALREAFPQYGILAEESGVVAPVGLERSVGRARELPDASAREAKAPDGPEAMWIVDPLDGTTNFAHGLGIFSVSIALARGGAPTVGVVYDPSRDELFWAEAGSGAYLNGRRIHVSSTNTLLHSMLVTGFAYDVATTENDNLDHFSHFVKRAQAVRRLGSAALDMCNVACGRFD